MAYNEVFDPDRMSQLHDIMPRFNAYVQPNDQIEMGIVGDNLYPYSADERPTATVLDVQRAPDGVELRVRDNATLEEMVLPKNSPLPNHVWEFSGDTFSNVLQRAAGHDEGGPDAMAEYGPLDGADAMSDGAADAMSADGAVDAMASELNETRLFAQNMVRVVNQVTKDMKRMESTMQQGFKQLGIDVPDGTLKFAPMFRAEYKTMMDDDASSSASGASEASSVSSGGSDFAEMLLNAP